MPEQSNKDKIHVVEIMASGASVHYFNLFAEKAKQHPEIKLSFVCLNEKPTQMLEDMKGYGCDCYWVYFDASKRKTSFIKAYRSLKKLFKKIKPDIVHSHLFDDGLPSVLAAKHAGVKVRVHTKQSTAFHWYFAPKAVWFDRLINRTATHLIAVSSEAQEFILEKEKAQKEKVHLIHHGISFENLTHATEEQKEEIKFRFNLEGKKVVGTLCRYIEWKGYKHLINAAERLKDKYPDLIFLGVGSGGQEAELKQIIKQKGLEDQFILTGWIEKKKIPAVIQSFNVYAHAAFMEPFGFVIPEVVINKIPIVTTPTGSARDAITHLKEGYIAPYNDSAKLAEGIDYMLSNNTEEFVNAAYEKVSKIYSIDLMWEKHLNLYKNAIAQLYNGK
ncbi:MAG: glycosyltransferase family 4 protein [Flavobacteriales bacterium]